MAKKDDEFLHKLLTTFRVEAGEHIEAISSGLLDLEKGPPAERLREIVDKIFREAHSLKGAARAVNLAEVESISHSLESVLAAVKNGRLFLSAPLFDLLHQATDTLRTLLSAEPSAKPETRAVIQRLDAASQGTLPGQRAAPAPASQVAAATPSLGTGTVRVRLNKLDAVMRQAEELFGPRLAAGQRASELRETGSTIAAWKRDRARILPARRWMERSLTGAEWSNGVKHKPEMTALLDYLETEDALLKSVEGRLARLERTAEYDRRVLTGIVNNLIDDVKQMHMQPFASLLEGFPRLARDLARDQGKEVELAIQGAEIEIDRRILEEMKDPLMHLLRNCLDHGIEKPESRQKKGKPPQGTVTISLSHRDGKVEIVVADDGTGIDLEKVRATAARLGLSSAAELNRLDEQQTLALIFHSGFSTSPIVTDISGRGLGLAIVREKVDRLGGTVTVENRQPAGATVRIVLPVTLATFRAVLARSADRLFILPAVNVERVARVTPADVRTVENRETISLQGKTVSLVWLSDVLELPRPSGPLKNAQVLVLGLGADRVGFRVDAVLGEQEVLVKRLGGQLARVRNVAGASVLGTGQVVPVLNVSDLMKSAVRTAAPRVAIAGEQRPEAVRRSILVVEDSITARTLLKNILEAAGYQVTTAVDGIDAFTTLKTGKFDLVVSDVEMPRMDGFGLTAKVRADKHLSGLPVILVTAMERREHRERGIDAGANAYIVKSSFDQSNLLETVRRLI